MDIFWTLACITEHIEQNHTYFSSSNIQLTVQRKLSVDLYLKILYLSVSSFFSVAENIQAEHIERLKNKGFIWMVRLLLGSNTSHFY